MGNIVTRNEVHRFTLKKEGVSTPRRHDVWYDPDVSTASTMRTRQLSGANSTAATSVLVITTKANNITPRLRLVQPLS